MGVKLEFDDTSDIMKKLHDMAKEKIMSMKHKVSCPHCNSSIEISAGKNICPKCSGEIDFELKENT